MLKLSLVFAALLIVSSVGASVAAGDEQRPRPREGAPDEAVAFDPLYFELSVATGGDFFFWTPGEFSRSPPMLLVRADEDLVVAHGALGSKREIEIPVDAGLARLDVFAGVQARAALELRDEAGRAVEDGKGGATLQRKRLMLLASIVDPSPGTWTLTLSGSGLFSVSARAQPDRDGEPVSFLGFSYVELRGRPGHEGYFERREPPPAGETALCRVSLEGAHGEWVVDVLDGEGLPLGLAAEAVEIQDEDGLLRCPVPTRPYRVRVRGRDASGLPFQRVEAALRDPMAVAPQGR